jgi:hypothetical protein
VDNSPAEIMAVLLENFFKVEDQGPTWPYFVNVQPDSPEENITLYDTEGKLQGKSVDGGLTVEKYGCQLRIRGRVHNTTRKQLNKINVWMDEVFNLVVTIDEQRYTVQTIMKSSGIIPLGMTKDKLYEFTLNVTVTIN